LKNKRVLIPFIDTVEGPCIALFGEFAGIICYRAYTFKEMEGYVVIDIKKDEDATIFLNGRALIEQLSK